MEAERVPPPSAGSPRTGAPRAVSVEKHRQPQEERASARRILDPPDPLLPELIESTLLSPSPFAPSAPRPAAFAFPESVPGHVEEITEVHVSIGRVEIVAPPGPAKQPARPPVERKSMSLDDYLARRRGGAR
jgi:hypothetical protein